MGSKPTPLVERIQSIWFSATEEEREDILAWIELVRKPGDAGHPAAS